MSEEETIGDLSGKLCNIDNESFAIGEKIPKEKLVKKKKPKILATYVCIHGNINKGSKRLENNET